MRSTAFKIIYGIMVLLIGFMFISNALMDRTRNFFEQEALVNLNEGKITDFVDNTMLIVGSNKYLEEPIYRFVYNSEDINFKVYIYHFTKESKKSVTEGIMLYLHDFSSKENFDGIRLEIKENSSTFISNNYNLKFKGGILKGFVAEPIYFGEGKFYNDTQNNSTSLSKINQINFKGIKEDKVLDDSFLEINNDDFYDLNSASEPEYKIEGKTIISNSFNGNTDAYKSIIEKYELEERTKTPDFTTLSKYNNVLTRTLILYAVVSTLTTALVFFGRPLLNKIKSRKVSKDIDKDN
ncbi:hypothetical protein [Haploplasma modicum]|uniref:hypothetical protein n=1 Tax=Haploplasma modicum TaxID=2150 RepID=UPI00214C4B3E|nr:hypothetical protein [Haploplasma modicum]MCR1808944.1 hypothetical protein [Haploplasma modicum]